MSLRARPALVGRRFLSVRGQRGASLPKLKHFYDWDWRAGWIRSSTSDDPADPDPEEVELCDISRPDSYEERSSSYVPVQALLHRNRTITTGTGASGYTSITDLPL